jgi:putative resolvase
MVFVVEHRDRLARFGVEHLDAAPAGRGRRVLVVGRGQTGDGLVREVIGVLSSMCSRRCGRRGARSRAVRAVTAAESTDVIVAV